MNQVSNCMGASQTHATNGARVNNPGGFTHTMTSAGTRG